MPARSMSKRGTIGFSTIQTFCQGTGKMALSAPHSDKADAGPDHKRDTASPKIMGNRCIYSRRIGSISLHNRLSLRIIGREWHSPRRPRRTTQDRKLVRRYLAESIFRQSGSAGANSYSQSVARPRPRQTDIQSAPVPTVRSHRKDGPITSDTGSRRTEKLFSGIESPAPTAFIYASFTVQIDRNASRRAWPFNCWRMANSSSAKT